MYAEPRDLDRQALVASLADGWGLRVDALEYCPVGFGSHHYIAQDVDGLRWFVTVDDLRSKPWLSTDPDVAFGELASAFRSAVILRRLGLEFVHAPVMGSRGVLERLCGRYAVSLFRFVDERSRPSGARPSVRERRQVLEALGRLHAVPVSALRRLPENDVLAIPQRTDLVESMGELDSEWAEGPYSEQARLLLASSRERIVGLLARYDELADAVRESSEGWVVTHGEPHDANVMRPEGGGLLLIDWDTVAVGPPERDLWQVEPPDDHHWSAYASTGPVKRPRPEAMELFRLWWQLTELADSTRVFRAAHEDDANSQAAWKNLQACAP